MKIKNIFLVALLGLIGWGQAWAQSSVTIFGVVDTAITRGSGSIANKTQLTNSNLSSSQLGFRGIEDIGGGLSAGFWLEAGFNSDDGTGQSTNTNNQTSGASLANLAGGQGLTFSRRSTVSIGGSWGEVRLGRDYAPTYWNLTTFDPFGTMGVGRNQMRDPTVTIGQGGLTGPTARPVNSISYAYGHGFNNLYNAGNQGFHFLIDYYVGENASNAANSKDGTGYSGRVGYNAGPVSVALATSRTEYLAGNARQTNLGASYDFGIVRVFGQYARDKLGAVDGKGYLLGALVPIGPHLIRASYSGYESNAAGAPESSKAALGYVYNFSKRTAVYATAARVKNSGSSAFTVGSAITAAGQGSTGYDLGFRHIF